MKTKPFNSIILNIPYREVTSGLHKDVELICGEHVVLFDLDCDIEIKYYSPSTYTHPEEYDLDETVELANIRVFQEDHNQELKLNKVQQSRLEQEIKYNLKVVY